MEYISMDVAMKYLMNNKGIFYKVRDSFLDSYKTFEEDYKELMEEQDLKGLELYIHSIKGISLNLGAEMLFESSVQALGSIRKELWNLEDITNFLTVLRCSYQELQSL